MLRQLINLRHYGRFRTSAPTPRAHKPALLKQRPELEIRNLLELGLAFQARPSKDFFFVQIGAFDGKSGDPLYRLIRRHHWRGILVEPQPAAFQQLQSNYAGEMTLQFFNVAIGPTDGELTLYSRKSGDVSVASTARHLLVKPGHSQNQVVALQVPCWTLQTLLAKAKAPARIDLLQIDTEGFDYDIIRSIDFNQIKPAIIRYEHTILSQRDRNACLSLLASQGYRFLLEDMDTTALLDDSLENSNRASA
jgi:FkbM family methyltransferase